MPMAVEIGVALLLVLVAFILGIGLVRLAATLVICLVAAGACAFVIYQVGYGLWQGWREIIPGALATGFGAALLCLPALPFSSFYRKK